MIERLVLATGQLPGRARAGARVLLNGLALRMLSADRLRALDERYYARETVYRTREWNERGLTPWERELVAGLVEPGGSVYVVGCGGGREVLGLVALGYEARGCEAHPDLAAFAAELLPGRIDVAPRDMMPAGAACDLVLLGWGTYGLVHERGARTRLLTAARSRAPVVALSCFGVPGHGLELRLTARLARVELGATLAPNRVHVFTREQLAEEAGAAGLGLERWSAVAPADGAVHHHAAVLR